MAYSGTWSEADFDAIRYRSRLIAGHEFGVCMLRTEANTVSGCWCHGAGPGGGNLPCPPRPDPQPAAPKPPSFHFPDMPVPWKG